MSVDIPQSSSTIFPLGVTVRGLTRRQAAAFSGLSLSGFDKARRDGKLPNPTLPGKRYDLRLLEAEMDKLSGISTTNPETPLQAWKRANRARAH